MDICIIGAGVSGLSAGKLLSKKHKVTIYERSSNIGGIARTKNVKGIAYHTVGGHCFNSKKKEVMDFVFNEVLSIENWHKVKRDAKINFHDHFISYPIEFSVKEIHHFDENLAFNITKDFISSENREVTNLADWFIEKFGKTLAAEYFIPYNRKIWQMEPSEMSHLWVEGKLPLPNKKDFFTSLVEGKKDSMPHSTFFYPNSNDQNTFLEALGFGLNIIRDFNVEKVKKTSDKWVINDKFEFDLVINTMPLNIFPSIVFGVPDNILEEAKKLKYNKVTNMLWKTKPVDFTWSYYPSENTIFHRHIHIGNFFNPKENYTITESIGEHTYKEMLEYGKEFDYLIEPVDYNVSDYAYVVYDQNYTNATNKIKQYLKDVGLYSIGRFGEWEYYNMDICIESAMKIASKIDRGLF